MKNRLSRFTFREECHQENAILNTAHSSSSGRKSLLELFIHSLTLTHMKQPRRMSRLSRSISLLVRCVFVILIGVTTLNVGNIVYAQETLVTNVDQPYTWYHEHGQKGLDLPGDLEDVAEQLLDVDIEISDEVIVVGAWIGGVVGGAYGGPAAMVIGAALGGAAVISIEELTDRQLELAQAALTEFLEAVEDTYDTHTIPYGIWNGTLAQEFTTGSNSHGYDVSAIGIYGRFYPDYPMNFPASISIWSGPYTPVAHLYTLSFAKWANDGSHGLRLVYQPESPATLEPDTRYVIFVGHAENSRVVLTSSASEDSGASPGWSIANTLSKKSGDLWRLVTPEDAGRKVFPADAFPVLRIGIEGSSLDSRSITLSLTNVGEGQFKATATASAPSDIVLPITIINGTIEGGSTTVTIPAGSTESDVINVSRIPGTTFPVIVNIGNLPNPPAGYELFKTPTRLPIQVLEGLSGGPTPVGERTPQVRDAIVQAAGVSADYEVTEAHLATIRGLGVNHPSGTPLSSTPIQFQIGDFSGLTALATLEMNGHAGIILPDGIFDDLTSLERLSLYNSKFTTIPNAVLGLTSLKILNMGYHRIASIPAGAFDQLTQLNTLILDGAAYANTFTSLPAGVFDNLTSLTRLDLAQNKITSLPDGVFDHLTSLERLNLERNSLLSSLPDGVFDNLTSLISLNLSGVKLTSLPDGVFDNLTSLTSLTIRGRLSSLSADDFSGLSSLTSLDLSGNQLTSLPAGIFSRLPSLTSLRLGRNVVDPLPLTVSLEKVGEGQFKAIAPTGAPFDIVLPVSARNGSISSGVNTLTIPKGSMESTSLTVTRTPGTTAAVTADIGTLPGLPTNATPSSGYPLHQGYTLVKSNDLPLFVISRLVSGFIPVSERTPQVRDAIVAAVPGVNSVNEVTEAHLAAITDLDLSSQSITSLKVGDFEGLTGLEELHLGSNQLTILPEDIFDGLTVLTTLRLYGNQLSSLPEDIFDELTSLTWIQLGYNRFTTLPSSIFDGLTKLTVLAMRGNQFTTLPDGIFEGLTGLTRLHLEENAAYPLPLTVSLEKVGDNQFKAVAPTGAPFDIVLPLNIANGTIYSGATTITIPAGSLESEPLTVLRTSDRTSTVTVNIGTLPGLPTNHSGYSLVKSDDLPLTFTGLDPVFTPVSERTPQVRDQIVLLTRARFQQGISANNVTPVHVRSITYLSLRNKSITSLKTGDFSGMPSLETLILDNNSITSLPEDVFDGLSALKELWLQSNALTSLPVDVFEDLSALEKLQLASNSLTSLPEEVFDGLSKLATIDLYNNSLSSLPEEVFDGLSVLETLFLRNNSLASLPEDIFDGLSNLITLELSSNSLASLPGDIFDEVSSLTTLRLSSNALTSLPEGVFEGLSNLTSISMHSNSARLLVTVSLERVGEGQFKAVAPTGAPFEMVLPLTVTNGSINGGATSITIPAGSVESEILTVTRASDTTNAVAVDIGTLPGLPSGHSDYRLVKSPGWPLEFTELGGTTLIRVSERTPQVRDAIMANLNSVRVNDMSIDDVSLAHLKAITYLDLQVKSITSLKSSDFEGLTSLRSIGLWNNDLTTLPDGIFEGLTALTRIPLYGNDLTTLPAGIFEGLTSLTTIELQSNNLTTLPAGIFEGLTSLTTISLSRNDLTTLPDGIFDGLTALTAISLWGNDLTTLPDGIFDGLTALTAISLWGNDLTTLPDGIFEGLTSLTTLKLRQETTDLSLTVSLEKVADGQFKAVAPTGAPFNIVLPLTVTNGSISGDVTSIMIPIGSVESDVLTVNRPAGSTAAVTVDIGTLPGLPTDADQRGSALHQGYELAKSPDLPLEVISAGPTVVDTQRTSVNIPDPNLRAKIEDALGKTSGDPITATEMATLTSLNAQDSSISDLTGLETATNLTTLKLGNNSISDISALAGLTSLTELQLWDNPFSNLSILASLTNLTKLYIWRNGISDISVLAGLTSLTQLKINENTISNISILSRLTNLTELSLKDNAISDISALAGLTNLTELQIGNNTITNITPVQNLTKLVWLDMPNNSISDISVVQNLTKLAELYFQNNAVSDLSPLVANTGFGEFTELNASGNPLNYPSIYTHIPALQARNVYIEFDNRVATTPVKISGDTQSGTTGTTLAQPFVVEVQDASRVAFAGVPVTFAVTAGGGTLSATNTTTDTNGRAESTLTLGNTAGTNTVRVSIQGVSQTATFTATATTTNTAPVFTDGTSTTRTIAENTAAGVNIGAAIAATDADNDTLTYTLSGTDAASFSINSSTGQLQTKSSLDYETKTVYTVTITVSDGSLTDTITVTINVTDIDDTPTATTAINIPDPNLRAKIEDALGKASGDPISATEMATLTSLTAQDASISNLTGLETATNLTTLKLGDNSISDISALAGLTNLTELQLWDNQISNLSILASLTNLTKLYIWGNSISDISALAGLTSLTQLKISENTISNISILSRLTNLTELSLKDNAISDISALAGLTNLTELLIGNNTISDITPVQNLTNLEWLDMPNNRISDVTAVVNLTNLVELYFQDNTVSGLSPLVANTGFGEYTELDARGNPLSYPSIYTHIPALQARNVYIDFDNRVATAPVKISGDTQSGTTGTTLAQPFVVEVQDGSSVAFAGVPVTFAITAGGGTLNVSNTATNANGRAESTLTLGNTAGTNTVHVSVQGISQAATFTATATTTNTAPTFTDGTSTTRTIAENTAAGINIGTAIAATDANNDPLTYTLAGTDASAFDIDSTTGQLTTKAVLDYETKSTYTVTVTVSDGTLTDSITVTINITDVAETPTETGVCQVGNVLAPGESCTYPGTDTEFSVLSDGRGQFLFFTSGTSLNIKDTEINGVSYTLVTEKLASGSWKIEEIADSAETPGTTNTAPVFIDGASTTRTIAENTAAGVNIGSVVVATDADNDTLTYTLSGTDAASFSISSSTGQLQTKAALDYETKTTYTVTVTVSDGSLTDTITVTINVNDVADTPVVSTLTPVCDRTPQVRDAIVAAVPGVSDCSNVTETHLAAIRDLLDLRDKNISALKPGDFEGLSSLQELRLESNQLRALPADIFSGLSSLRRLYLGNNQLTSLPPDVFSELTALHDLYLHNNQLTSLPVDLFAGLSSLRQINLHTNRLTNLPADIFSGLSSLTQLFLRNNKLTSLPADLFSGLSSLQYLYLDGNRLTSLLADLFSGLPSLTQLFLNKNQMSTLSVGMFRGLTASTQLWLQGNRVDPLPLTISLEKVGDNQFKATVPAGAPFTITLPLRVANGAISGGANTLTIPQGSVESGRLTVTRTAGTTAAVTVDIGTLPGLPTNHQGYQLTRSANLPLEIFSSAANRAPTFTEGASTTRAVAENTAPGVNIGAAIAATDADNDTLTYTLSGTDAASFSINSSTGQLQTKSALDYETKTTYTVTVTVSDGSLTDTITVTINVTDVDEAPTDIGVCKVGDILAPGESCTYPGTDATFSVLDNGHSQWNIPDLPSWLAWINQTSIGGSMRISATINNQDYHFVAEEVSNDSWEIKEIGEDRPEQPETPEQPEQPGDVGETPTLTVSTASSLTEATLHGGVATLTLSGGTYESAVFDIRRSLTVSGITGADFETFSVVRVSDTQATVELEFDGNISTSGTLTFNLDSDAITNYEGAALTSQISVPAVTESVVASTASPLTEATLDESVVTLTLSGRKFEQWTSKIRGAMSVSGITGATFETFSVVRVNDTEVSAGLTFDGNINSDSTLTFTVGADAIAGYDGAALTAQVSVSATTEAPTVPDSQTPQQPQQPGSGGATPTLTASTTAPLTEATLHESIVTLTLSGAIYEDSTLKVRDDVTVSTSISGVTVDWWDIDEVSDTEVAVELTFDGDFDTNATLTFTVGAGAIAGYNGNALTAQVPVTGGPESIVASTTAPLTETTLNESVVTLTLNGGKFERNDSTVRTAVSVSGIAGVTVQNYNIDRESDTEVTVELTFNGNINTNSTLTFTVGADAIAGYDGAALTAQVSVSASEEPVEIGGGTPTLRASTPSPLTEATLNESVVTLTLTGGTYESTVFDIRRSLTVSGITRADFEPFSVVRVSDTQATVELEFDGNISTNSTLTFTLRSDAIANYDGDALTSQISVSALPESVVASTASPLTEATLDESVVTLTLTGATYERAVSQIRDAVTVSGINGVTKPWHEPDRESNTELTLELEFDGTDFDTNSTLTFTVGAGAIAGYNGPPLTAQLSVSASTETPVVTDVTDGQTPVTPQQPQQQGGGDSTLTLRASTPAPLTEATLHESVVTLTLTGGTYERSTLQIRDAVTVSGINGVTKLWHEPDRESDTELTLELEFDGTDFDTNSTLTLTVGADAIADYNGPALTVQVSVTASTESIVATTASPLTEATLDESVVTLTLTGATYERAVSKIRDAVTVSGINGVTKPWHEPDRESDTELTLELEFDGTNFDSTSTLIFTVGADAIADYNGPALTAQITVTATEQVLRAPSGISLMHVPLQVTVVDGVTQTIESVGDLYDALGGMNTVNLLITHNPETQSWHSYLGEASRGTSADTVLTDSQGIIADMKAPVSLHLDGNALGSNGSSSITLHPGTNLVGVPLRDSRITRVSDLFALERIRGNVSTVTVLNNGTFQTVERAGDAGDIPITGGQSFILNAWEETTVAVSGQGWGNVSGVAAAAPVALTGIQVMDTTPILALRGSIVSPVGEWNRMPHLRSGSGFRVIVKNLSTRKSVATMTGDEGGRYQLTVVDTEAGRAAQIGDILEISVRSPDPRIGVQPLRHTVTAEDVKWSRVELGNLIVYEIPTETELLPNYPNPFNPETWIPYRLAEDAVVNLTIYDTAGGVVRSIDVGHKPAAVYESKAKAIYWDGRNEFGEGVASGVYFYHLSAGRSGLSVPHRSDFSATRKMLILK